VIITVRGLAAWLCAFAFSSAVAQSDVAYKAIVDASNAATGTVEVKVSFRGNSSGETVVVLPRGLANPDLEFSGDVRSIETNPALGQALVSHAPGAWISTSYRIQHGLKGRPASYAQDAYRPIILPDLTYLIGENTLVRPGWMTTVGSATVSVIGLAESASIFTSAPENKSPFTTDASLESLTNFVILSGPLRAHPLDDEESGRIVLAGSPGARVEVSLVWGGGVGSRHTIVIENLAAGWSTRPLDFHVATAAPGGGTDNGRLEIVARGGAVRVGAVSLMPADNRSGWRADTLARLRELDAPVYRGPGGNVGSG